MAKPRPGTYGVAGIFAWVIAWDLFGPEDITDAVRAWCKHPIKRWPTGAMILLTALHLLDACPKRLDPWHYMGRSRVGMARVFPRAARARWTEGYSVPSC